MPYRYDRDSMGGGVLLYITDGSPANMILELILKICQLKLIYKKASGFLMAFTIHIKIKFQIT